MKIIISPAKRMRKEPFLKVQSLPVYLPKTKEILEELKKKTIFELKQILQTNDILTNQAYKRVHQMNLEEVTPSLIAYDGIQYTYMSSSLFTDEEYEFLNQHLYILSGFYGVLKPLDGICSYRLELQAKLKIQNHEDLYAFWGDLIYQEVFQSHEPVLNLCSLEYQKAILPYLKKEDFMIDVLFLDFDSIKQKWIEKAVYVKMARGRMIRFIANHKITSIEEVKQFQDLGYSFSEEKSSLRTYVFTRK